MECTIHHPACGLWQCRDCGTLVGSYFHGENRSACSVRAHGPVCQAAGRVAAMAPEGAITDRDGAWLQTSDAAPTWLGGFPAIRQTRFAQPGLLVLGWPGDQESATRMVEGWCAAHVFPALFPALWPDVPLAPSGTVMYHRPEAQPGWGTQPEPGWIVSDGKEWRIIPPSITNGWTVPTP